MQLPIHRSSTQELPSSTHDEQPRCSRLGRIAPGKFFRIIPVTLLISIQALYSQSRREHIVTSDVQDRPSNRSKSAFINASRQSQLAGTTEHASAVAHSDKLNNWNSKYNLDTYNYANSIAGGVEDDAGNPLEEDFAGGQTHRANLQRSMGRDDGTRIALDAGDVRKLTGALQVPQRSTFKPSTAAKNQAELDKIQENM